MKPLPTDPLTLQAYVTGLLCEDLFDCGSGRSSRFERTDAVHEILKRRDGSESNKPLPTDK